MSGVAVPDEICLRNARDWAERLAALVVSGADVSIDGSRFTAVDVAGVQLLMSAHRTAQHLGARFSVRLAVSGALHDALVKLGVADADGRPILDSHPFALQPGQAA